MRIPVLIEKLEQNGYRVRGEPFSGSVEGATREEALRKFKESVEQRLAAGAEVVQLDLNDSDRPWMKFRGRWAVDDPVIDEWIKCVEDYRRQVDADPNVP